MTVLLGIYHSSGSQVLAENIRRGEAGEAFLYLVDRAAGY